MQIGSVKLAGNLTLAPMAAYTSWPFRRICRRFGAALVTTEVVKARDLARRIPATLHVMTYQPDEHPIAGQIMSGDPAEAAAAVEVLNELGFDFIDLNCGCPKRRILSDGMGGALSESPESTEKIVAAMVARAKVPVTVKIRAGRFRGQVTAIELAKRAVGAGAIAVCVHPRFAEGAASLPPDWPIIGQVKRAVNVPVIGNGGVHTALDVSKMIQETGCDGVAIGQAAVGKPWIFHQAGELLRTGEVAPVPDQSVIRGILLEHYAGLVSLHGERRGTIMMRKQSCHYAKALLNGKKFNLAVTKISTTVDFMKAVEEYLGEGQV